MPLPGQPVTKVLKLTATSDVCAGARCAGWEGATDSAKRRIQRCERRGKGNDGEGQKDRVALLWVLVWNVMNI